MKMQLCHDNLQRFLELNPEPLYWTYKVDGVRCLIHVSKRTIPDKGSFRKIADIRYLSRNNLEFYNLNHFNPDILEICHFLNRERKIAYPIGLECEIAAPSLKLSEVMTQLRRKEVTHPKFLLYFFDLVLDRPYTERQKLLQEALKQVKNPKIFYLYPHPAEPNIAVIERIRDDAISKGFEGIVLQRGTAHYEDGRSWNCCKVKDFKTVDLRVVGVREGEPGSRLEGKAAALICDFNGQKIAVSGRMNDRMREELLKNPPIGKYVEVKYLEITPDGRLRHPVFLRFRPDLE